MVYSIHKFRKIERACMDLYLCTTSVAVLLLYIFMQRCTCEVSDCVLSWRRFERCTGLHSASLVVSVAIEYKIYPQSPSARCSYLHYGCTGAATTSITFGSPMPTTLQCFDRFDVQMYMQPPPAGMRMPMAPGQLQGYPQQGMPIMGHPRNPVAPGSPYFSQMHVSRF